MYTKTAWNLKISANNENTVLTIATGVNDRNCVWESKWASERVSEWFVAVWSACFYWIRIQIAPINTWKIQKPSNQICPLVAKDHQIILFCIRAFYKMENQCHYYVPTYIDCAKSSKPIKYQRNCVSVIRCFMIPSFNSLYATHPLPSSETAAFSVSRSFFNRMTSSCVRRHAKHCCCWCCCCYFHSVMSVNVFVHVCGYF